MSYDPTEHIALTRVISENRRKRVEKLIAVGAECYDLGELSEAASWYGQIPEEMRALNCVRRILEAFEKHSESARDTAQALSRIQGEYGGRAELFAEHFEYLVLNLTDKE